MVSVAKERIFVAQEVNRWKRSCIRCCSWRRIADWIVLCWKVRRTPKNFAK